jgi:hypothetical protein
MIGHHRGSKSVLSKFHETLDECGGSLKTCATSCATTRVVLSAAFASQVLRDGDSGETS